MNTVRLSFLLMVFCCPLSARSQTVPNLVNYQGKITDASGMPVPNGSGYELEIRLWPTSAGTEILLWGSSYSGVTLRDGGLNLILGSAGGVPIPGAQTTDLTSAFSKTEVYLGIKVTKTAAGIPIANPTEILPRQQWMTAPFAFKAGSVSPNAINSASIADGAIQRADLTAAFKAELNQLVPAGTVVAFAGANIPAGWLRCDGAAVSRSQYSLLFSAMGMAHGSGNGSTTFNLPDYRGRFLRGVNESANGDPDAAIRSAMALGGNTGNTVGSIQSDDLKAHSHDAFFAGPPNGSGLESGRVPVRANRADGPNEGRIPTDLTGGAETRPKNAYVVYIIKH